MESQESLPINDPANRVEDIVFDLPQPEPIKGFPELRWSGKRPFRSTRFYSAQLKESYGDPIDGWFNRIYWGDNLQVMSHLRKELLDPLKETSLRFTINVLAKELENSGSRMVACCNYTGTPYVKNGILPEDIYYYGLKAASGNGYLKTLLLHKYRNTRDSEFVAAVVGNFLEKFGDRRLEEMLPKLAFFSPSIEDANDNLRPIL